MKTYIRQSVGTNASARNRRQSVAGADSLSNQVRADIRNILGRAEQGGRSTSGTFLAATHDGHTEFSPAVDDHPMSELIKAHEAVHREQFVAFGTKPQGTREQLESEAEQGARALVAGRAYGVCYGAAPGEMLTYSDKASKSGTPPWGTREFADKGATIRFIESGAIKVDSHHLENDGTERYGYMDGFIVITPTGDMAYFRSPTTIEKWKQRETQKNFVGPPVELMEPQYKESLPVPDDMAELYRLYQQTEARRILFRGLSNVAIQGLHDYFKNFDPRNPRGSAEEGLALIAALEEANEQMNRFRSEGDPEYGSHFRDVINLYENYKEVKDLKEKTETVRTVRDLW